MINEMDDGIKYFEDEIMKRLRTTAQLISQIEFDPVPRKIKALKQVLMQKNNQKQNQEYNAREMDMEGLLEEAMQN